MSPEKPEGTKIRLFLVLYTAIRWCIEKYNRRQVHGDLYLYRLSGLVKITDTGPPPPSGDMDNLLLCLQRNLNSNKGHIYQITIGRISVLGWGQNYPRGLDFRFFFKYRNIK